MADNRMVEVNGVKVDTERVNRLLARLIIAEKKNIRTKEKNDMQMVNTIKKMIEEEVECY